jgi:hypothetical protein
VNTSEKTYEHLLPRLRATFNQPAVRKATDAQKQELYEHSIAALTFVTAMAEHAETDEQNAKVAKLADAFLISLIGTGASNLAIDPETGAFSIKSAAPTPPAPATPPVAATDAAPVPPINTTAPGFTYTLPEGFNPRDPWLVREVPKNNYGNEIGRVFVRFPNAIPREADAGAALAKLWSMYVPPEGRASPYRHVYRRYTGDRLPTYFIGGLVMENGRKTSTSYTIYLIAGKTYWQPVVVALNYDSNLNVEYSAWASFKENTNIAESVLAALRFPDAKELALFDARSLVGEFTASGGSFVDERHVITGASSTRAIATSNALNLKPDGTFTSAFAGAGGRDGDVAYNAGKSAGTWSLDGDQLVLTRPADRASPDAKPKPEHLRVVAITSFADGSRELVVSTNLTDPVNLVTLGNDTKTYSSKKP